MSKLADDVRKLHAKLAKTDPEKARLLREALVYDQPQLSGYWGAAASQLGDDLIDLSVEMDPLTNEMVKKLRRLMKHRPPAPEARMIAEGLKHLKNLKSWMQSERFSNFVNDLSD